MHKVSVIIPVYNGERYLRECLDSVCAQTLEDIEIICVDDGSTDSSCEIIQSYMDKDSRISLLHQKNQFAGIARNNGLEHADGEYVAFWDCDDTFEPDALECMYNRAKEVDADICLCGITDVDEVHNVRASYNQSTAFLKRLQKDWFNREDDEDHILSCDPIPVWSKLIRRAFLDRIHLRFTDHRHAEDMWFTWIALCSADRITVVDKPLINHRICNATSQMGLLDEKDPTILPSICCQTAQYLKEHGIFPERSFVNSFFRSFRYGIRMHHSIAKQLELIAYTQQNCLEELCICPREPGFYDSEELEAMANHLLADSPEEFLGFLNYETALQLSVKSMKLSAKNSEVKQLRAKNTRLKKRMSKGFLHRITSAVKRRLKKNRR